jgi:hypothetical protein
VIIGPIPWMGGHAALAGAIEMEKARAIGLSLGLDSNVVDDAITAQLTRYRERAQPIDWFAIRHVLIDLSLEATR